MQRPVRLSAIAAIAVVISVTNFNGAEARRAASLGCGKELQKQCGGVPMLSNNARECVAKSHGKLSPRCVAFVNYVVSSCERDAVQYCQAVVAGQSSILGCLRTANRVVSPQCNAALDAAYVRQ